MLLYFTMRQHQYPAFPVSSLYLYYNTRLLMGTTSQDTGSIVDQAFLALQTYGFCPDVMWPFCREHVCCEPPPACYAFASSFPCTVHRFPVHGTHGIQEALANGRLVLASMYRFSVQSVHPSTGYLHTDFESAPLSYLHSVLVVGIYPSHVVVLDSHGILNGRDGFFFVDNHMIPTLFADLIACVVKIQFPNVFPRIVPCLSLVPRVDAIVVGAGITGLYTAYRLGQMGQRVAVIDNGAPKNVGGLSVGSLLFDLTAYRFSPVIHRRLAQLMTELCIPVRPCDALNHYNRHVLQDPMAAETLAKLSHYCSDCVTTEDRVQLLSRYGNASVDDVLSTDSWTEVDRKTISDLCQRDVAFCLDDTLPFCMMAETLLTSMRTDFLEPVDHFGALVERLETALQRQGVSILPFQPLLATEQLQRLTDSIGFRQCQAQLTDESSTAADVVVSLSAVTPVETVPLTVRVRAPHVYWASPQTVPPGCPPIVEQQTLNLLFFWSDDQVLPSFFMTQRPLWGRVFVKTSHVWNARICKPRDVQRVMSALSAASALSATSAWTGIIRDVDAFPSLEELLRLYPLAPPPDEHREEAPRIPKSFVLLCDPNNFGYPCLGEPGESYLKIMQQAIRPEGAVHYLNSNYSTLYGWIEGALEMADLALSTTRTRHGSITLEDGPRSRESGTRRADR